MKPASPFALQGVTHLLSPWGDPVSDLEGLLQRLETAPEPVLFAHSVFRLLRDATLQDQVMDDISHWVATALQDPATAERLWLAFGSAESSATSVRQAALEVLSHVPARHRTQQRAPEGAEFVFLAATSVPYRSGEPIADPSVLLHALLQREPSVWFLHLHEAPWHLGGACPVAEWLEAHGEAVLAHRLLECARAGLQVEVSRTRFRRRWRLRRLAQSGPSRPEDSRADQQAVARRAARALARRIADGRGEP